MFHILLVVNNRKISVHYKPFEDDRYNQILNNPIVRLKDREIRKIEV